MIDGFAVGHHTADGDGWLTGTTVVLSDRGAVGGVDVRGGAPGTRETDLLDPRALVEQVDAVVLCGGSAYGLAAVDGVMLGLAADGRGLPVGTRPDEIVPIVPAAVIFDLGRGGVFAHRPTAEFGARAYEAARRCSRPARRADPASGCVGAGTGAAAGGLKGGFGYAEAHAHPWRRRSGRLGRSGGRGERGRLPGRSGQSGPLVRSEPRAGSSPTASVGWPCRRRAVRPHARSTPRSGCWSPT